MTGLVRNSQYAVIGIKVWALLGRSGTLSLALSPTTLLIETHWASSERPRFTRYHPAAPARGGIFLLVINWSLRQVAAGGGIAGVSDSNSWFSMVLPA